MLSYVFPTMIGGLGILLIALKILGAHMKELTSGYVRSFIKKRTSTHAKAAFWGCLLGFTLVDPIVVVFITTSLWSCRSINANSAMTMTVWSNLGACFLFFLAFINMDLVVLYLLGIVGFAYFIEKPFNLRHFLGSAFAVLLMLYAFMLIRSQSSHIAEISWVNQSLHEIQSSFWKPYLLAAFLTAIIQSDLVVLVLTLDLTQGGIISLDQTIFMLFGTQLGLGLASFIIMLNVRGALKQLLFVLSAINIFIGIVFAALFVVEIYANIPLIKAMALLVSPSVWSEIIFIIFFCNVTSCLLFSIFMDRISRFVQRLIPIPEVSDPGMPRYIFEGHVADPESSLDLLEAELLELLKRLPLNIEYKIQNIQNIQTVPILKKRHEQFASVNVEIEEFLKELNLDEMTTQISDRMLALAERWHIINSLESDVYHLTQVNLPIDTSGNMHEIALNIYREQQSMLQTIVKAMESGAETDLKALKQMINSIRLSIENTRLLYFKGESQSSILGRSLILKMTSLFERGSWLILDLSHQLIK